ncbi:MAG TPA: phasin family protein [Thermoanaerobaculia bacterium]|nr:phasin family protein [Thermoanaerobaculia bacterium]
MSDAAPKTTGTGAAATDRLADAGRTIWLAGLGALGEIERGGREAFDRLVERGRRVEGGQFRAVDRTVSRAAESAERLAEEADARLRHGVDTLLHRANLPTRGDLAELSARLDRLSERLEHLTETPR